MSVPVLIELECASCGTAFTPKRAAQRACSPACKQSLFRAEKCNARTHVSEKPSVTLDEPPRGFSGGVTRQWPGIKPLSELECRAMGIRSIGKRDQSGWLIFNSRNENGPAEAATSPSRGSQQPSKGN